MEFTQQDFDRLLLFEHTRKTAEDSYAKDPLDAENLTKWGGALLELSQFQNVADAKTMIGESMSKLEEALNISPERHDALWCLGNAHTSMAFLTSDFNDAKVDFERATEYFEKAAEGDPTNEIYKKSLEVAGKAPELHMEIHKQGAMQQTMSAGPAPGKEKNAKKKKNSDLKYDILGWVILAVGIVAWVGMAKSQLPPPPR
ncbi:mitochondrial import receptor subunit TOM20-like [Rutidosis leptorrhynchoides]|uniref:mitochondrial import receptor subunit TOM20-like n=1 Tax=Rutidosis leptorrhynchoides TaxID=125765 RepID=UPI003A9A4DE1